MMKNKQLLLNLIIVGMTLGTNWAIRGQFGHEQGAAWAGAVGALVIILLSGRVDWNSKLFKATMAAAIGWGLGGLMSYGVVVGYGRGTDFVNVYYGLLMLFVIGGLYGFVGGGLFGLVLVDSKAKKVNWLSLFTGSVASAIVCYFFIIIEWEWFMTPPRSEVWAACLGVGAFLLWFTKHYDFSSALRVAVFSGLGGGFGFAFGDFLQVLGNVSGISFNFWNVMEYSLGFFGGLGMAYGTFTSSWESSDQLQTKSSNLIPILFVVLFIPFVVWDQTFSIEKIQGIYAKLLSGDVTEIAWIIKIGVLALILLNTAFFVINYHFRKPNELVQYSNKEVKTFFFSHFALYTLFSLLITGALISTYRIEQYLYLVNLIVILIVIPKLQPVFSPVGENKNWGRNFVLLLLIIAVLAFIAINTHGEMPGMQRRFEF
tara:strand:+ start:10155 stop:11441 length:1287 start_codon:yes stop_codon:yes gene_type:complete